jgi:hypothetical protein
MIPGTAEGRRLLDILRGLNEWTSRWAARAGESSTDS